MRLLWKGTLLIKQKSKCQKAEEEMFQIVAFLTPTGKGNTGQVILKVIKSHDVI